MIQANVLIAHPEIGFFVGIILEFLLLGKENVVDEGIILALGRKSGEQHQCLILPQLILPARRGEEGVGGIVLDFRVIDGGGGFVRPSPLGVADGIVLLRCRGQEKHGVYRACIVAEAAHELALGGHLDGV